MSEQTKSTIGVLNEHSEFTFTQFRIICGKAGLSYLGDKSKYKNKYFRHTNPVRWIHGLHLALWKAQFAVSDFLLKKCILLQILDTGREFFISL